MDACVPLCWRHRHTMDACGPLCDHSSALREVRRSRRLWRDAADSAVGRTVISCRCSLVLLVELLQNEHPVAGGLGDVMGALPKALARRGHRVMVVAPRYSNYEEGWETGVRVQLSVGGSTVEVSSMAWVGRWLWVS